MYREKKHRQESFGMEGFEPLANSLAAAGFFKNQEDEGQCAFCLGILNDWDPDQRPSERHKRELPEMSF